jgi:TPR repeat protein
MIAATAIGKDISKSKLADDSATTEHHHLFPGVHPFSPCASWRVGYARAQYGLGLRYETGDGVQRNYSEARRWYRLAAEQCLAAAQFRLGTMHARGLGGPLDPVEAAKWFRRAAEQGHVDAQISLGRGYESTRGVTQDYRRANLAPR